MVLFGMGSSINSLINSFEEFKNMSRKYSQTQTKTFNYLQEWSVDTNNTAFQDVTSKLNSLYQTIDADLTKDKLNSLDEVVQMFKKFKEYDSKVSKFYQHSRCAEKYEKRCEYDMSKCPMNKNMRDYEIKHMKAKQDREKAQLKYYEYSNEIDATKTILFKKHMKQLNECLMRQNEAERVLLTAMNSLLNKIPDVSNEEVDDVNTISYKNHEQTDRICTKAKRKLNRLSSSAYGVKLENINEPVNEEAEIQPQVQQSAVESNKEKQSNSTRRSQYFQEQQSSKESEVSAEPEYLRRSISNRLYPCLEKQIEVLDLEQPPPTYSESEYTSANDLMVMQQTHPLLKPSAPPASSINLRSVKSQIFTLDQDSSSRQLDGSPSSFEKSKQ